MRCSNEPPPRNISPTANVPTFRTPRPNHKNAARDARWRMGDCMMRNATRSIVRPIRSFVPAPQNGSGGPPGLQTVMKKHVRIAESKGARSFQTIPRRSLQPMRRIVPSEGAEVRKAERILLRPGLFAAVATTPLISHSPTAHTSLDSLRCSFSKSETFQLFSNKRNRISAEIVMSSLRR